MNISDTVSSYLLALFLAMAFMTGVFSVARGIKRYDLVDAGWGFVFIVIGLATMMYSTIVHQTDIHPAKLAVVSVIAIWGARLATHIVHRITRTKEVDPRYVEIYSKWKTNTERQIFFRIYMLQAFLASVVALPIIMLNSSSEVIVTEFVVFGLVLWVLGFIYESTADLQLESFVAKHPGKLMTKGLYRYSRHPNYFGELVQWWAIAIMAFSVEGGWVGIVGPLLLTFVILYVSGIPPAEKRLSRKEGWAQYKYRTSAIVPLMVLKKRL